MEDILESFVKNHSISFEVLLELVNEVPEIAKYLIQYLYSKVPDNRDIFVLLSYLGLVKTALEENTDILPEEVNRILSEGIDNLLEETVMLDNLFDLFMSVTRIARHIIQYNKDVFIVFFERFTVALNSIKEVVEHHVQNAEESYGQFPVDLITDSIMGKTFEGLGYALYFNHTIQSYNIMTYNTILVDYLDKVESAFNILYVMEILPEDWLSSDRYYQYVLDKDNKESSVTTDDFKVEDVLDGLDLSDFLE